MGYGGDAHDYYREEDRYWAVKNMVDFGYSEKELERFDTNELKLMHKRLVETKKMDYVDSLIDKLNEGERR